MANSYHRVVLHCVWTTKRRENLIHRDWESSLWAYLGGIARSNGMHPIQIGGVDNHIHACLDTGKHLCPKRVLQILKTGSSKWINESGISRTCFKWQTGYGAFSVSASGVAGVRAYILRQREHHAHKTFEEEYRELLDAYGIAFEEVYLFD